MKNEVVPSDFLIATTNRTINFNKIDRLGFPQAILCICGMKIAGCTEYFRKMCQLFLKNWIAWKR